VDTGFLLSRWQLQRGALEGVKILLGAGADRNDTGDPKGFQFSDLSLPGTFSVVQGLSPLNILKNFDCVDISHFGLKKTRKGAPGKIEKILLQYGARDLTIPGRELDND
jgi:hypothetical protein